VKPSDLAFGGIAVSLATLAGLMHKTSLGGVESTYVVLSGNDPTYMHIVILEG
jgi:hypothetical protein